MNNETYCEYVSSRGIGLNCDVYPKNFSSDTRSFNETEYLNISNNDKVYVITSVLNHN